MNFWNLQLEMASFEREFDCELVHISRVQNHEVLADFGRNFAYKRVDFARMNVLSI